MPIFHQQQVGPFTRLGIWKIEETEAYFKANVPQHRDVTHPHKRLQHLAGRFLLQFLFPDFPFELIQIADTRKPFLPEEQYHFSISHCGNYAAAIVSQKRRVGIDVELVRPLVAQLIPKFLSAAERHMLFHSTQLEQSTLMWSAKEAVFKWYGDGAVDFRQHIQLQRIHEGSETIDCFFAKTGEELMVHYRVFDRLVLAWVVT
ncbi:MAG TPA: 4'-phosphopantetheinyl transferase superfamily protein [Chitinophagaceae bacterium]|nr:4'-phosphopantetheinyl transferase superfamily protein [Chitinophagaceae bacterium]